MDEIIYLPFLISHTHTLIHMVEIQMLKDFMSVVSPTIKPI